MKRTGLAVAFLSAGALLMFLVVFLLPREPSYGGKSLRHWAQQYGSNHWSGNRALDKEATDALRQIGTNAIPFLLNLVKARDPAVKKKLRSVLPPKWHDTLRLRDTSGEVRRVGAHGLAGLGTNAASAVPTLIEVGKHHPDEDGRYIAVFALRTLGPASESAILF